MNLADKTKGIFENIEIKTGELIFGQKNNFKIAKVCSDLKKEYEKLGRLTYRKMNNIPVNDNEFDATVEKIGLFKLQLKTLREGVCGSGDSIVFEDGELVDDESLTEESND